MPFDWKTLVGNPEAFGEVEKKLWLELDPILREILDELKKRGKLETVFVQREVQTLRGTLEKNDELGIISNSLLSLFEVRAKFDRFLQASQEIGLTEHRLVLLYLMCGATLDMLNTESFKLLLLFHMTDRSHDVFEFFNVLKDDAPMTWHKLKPYIDNKFRNSIAHGTFAMIGGKVVLYDSARLEPSEEMEISEFMMRIKRQNVLYHCLLAVLGSRGELAFLRA